jgi:LAGLIDADG DNA endonuclease family
MKVQEVSYKRSLVIGMLLGDANSRKRNRPGGVDSVCFTVTHSQSQSDLVEWKAARMAKCYGVNVKVHHRNYEYSRLSTFSFTQGRRLRVIHDWFHRAERKVISEKVRFMDHPVGLAMLLCDDGSVRKRKKQHRDGTLYFVSPSITIATHCFSREEVLLLLDHIKRTCDAEGYINPERRVRGGSEVAYNRVNFNAENSKILWGYVSPWIPRIPSMMKKFEFIIERYGLNETADA